MHATLYASINVTCHWALDFQDATSIYNPIWASWSVRHTIVPDSVTAFPVFFSKLVRATGSFVVPHLVFMFPLKVEYKWRLTKDAGSVFCIFGHFVAEDAVNLTLRLSTHNSLDDCPFVSSVSCMSLLSARSTCFGKKLFTWLAGQRCISPVVGMCLWELYFL